MRIVSGAAKGRRLFAPKGTRIRPTSDRVKEALFNILTVHLGNFTGQRVLDLFAGTGNLGIESLSRGAEYALFVDENRESIDLVRKNLELTGFTVRGRTLQKEAVSALKAIEKTESPFSLVFLDPPYRKGLPAAILDLLATSALIDGRTLIVVETATGEPLPASFGRLAQSDRRVYGDTAISFFSVAEE